MNASATVTWEKTEEAAICEKHGEYIATTSTVWIHGQQPDSIGTPRLKAAQGPSDSRCGGDPRIAFCAPIARADDGPARCRFRDSAR